jgi:hypothetical protein
MTLATLGTTRLVTVVSYYVPLVLPYNTGDRFVYDEERRKHQIECDDERYCKFHTSKKTTEWVLEKLKRRVAKGLGLWSATSSGVDIVS